MAAITPLGLFSQVLVPGENFELETIAADVQLTGISFGDSVKGEGRSSVKLLYFDRSHSNFGLTPSFDSDDEDEDDDEDGMNGLLDGEEAEETDDEDDSGAVDEAALKAAMKEAAEKRKEAVKEAKVDGLSPRKLAQQVGDDDLKADEEEEDSDEDDDMMSDVSQDEMKEVFLGNLLPGRIESAPVNFVLKYMDTFQFSVTGENPVYLTGHYCHIPPPDLGDASDSDEDDSDYEGGEYDDLSDSEGGMYDPETGLPMPDMDTDGERFQEIAAAAEVPSKKSKKEKAAKTIPAAQIDDLSMDVDDSAKKPAAAAADVSTEGLSKNQKKKLKKAQAQAAGGKTDAPAAAPTASAPAPAAAAPAAASTAKKPSKKTTLPSGLIYEDVKAGAGAAAKKGQKVSMRYIGKLQNGNIFDSNTKGKPFEFKLGAGQVIKGWDEGIAGMQPGGERRLTIPAKLGYGKSGTDGIPGNATLVFEVKLLSIK